MKETKTLALTAVDSSAAELNLLSDRIWDSPETCYMEVTAVKLQTAFLREHGFAVEDNLGDIPTAFSGWTPGGAGKGVQGPRQALRAVEPFLTRGFIIYEPGNLAGHKRSAAEFNRKRSPPRTSG